MYRRISVRAILYFRTESCREYLALIKVGLIKEHNFDDNYLFVQIIRWPELLKLRRLLLIFLKCSYRDMSWIELLRRRWQSKVVVFVIAIGSLEIGVCIAVNRCKTGCVTRSPSVTLCSRALRTNVSLCVAEYLMSGSPRSYPARSPGVASTPTVTRWVSTRLSRISPIRIRECATSSLVRLANVTHPYSNRNNVA